MRSLLAALALALASFTQVAQAQTAPFTLPATEVRTLPTAANGIDYEIYVHASPACTPEAPCPAIYMLDAEYSFGLAALIADHLEQRGQLQPLVLVALAYQDKTQYRLNRSRDYTPIFSPDGGYGVQYQRLSGGGPAFLDVIADEIIPYVEASYPVTPAHRGLVGHSYGGLFASYVLLHRPDLFDRYLIVSPSYWYDTDYIFRLEAEPRPPLSRPTQAYFSVGSWEEQPENGHAMVSDLERLTDLLSAREDPNLELKADVEDDQTHASIFPIALSDGLRAMFWPED